MFTLIEIEKMMRLKNTFPILLLVFFLNATGQSKKQSDSAKKYNTIVSKETMGNDWTGFKKNTNQQVIYPSSNMPRVDIHTHMDSKTNYAKAIDSMDQWGGTISISLAGLFWVKDNNGDKAGPASVRQMPGNDMVYVKEKLDDRILFAPGAFTIPSQGIWWGVDEIKTFKKQGFVGLKLWPHGAILSSEIPMIHEQLTEAGKQGMPLIGFHTGDPGNLKGNSAAFPKI